MIVYLVRVAGIMSNWNIARYLSGCIFSQFQNQANVALHLNGWHTFGQALSNFAKLLYNQSYRDELRTLIGDFGVASDLFMKSVRAQQLVGISEQAGFRYYRTGNRKTSRSCATYQSDWEAGCLDTSKC